MGILGVASSLLTGVQTGVLGALATGALGYFKDKQEHKHKVDMLNAQVGIIQAQGASALALENAKALVASYASDKATYSDASKMTGVLGFIGGLLGVLTDFVRGITRPGVLWYLLTVLTLLCVHSILKVGMTDELMKNILTATVALALELVSMAGAWFYCSRDIMKLDMLRRGK